VKRPAHVVIVGGGISGLAAANCLIRLVGRDALRVTVLESREHFGGAISTRAFAGRALDSGPEAMLAAVPQGPRLCRELGLGDGLVAPTTDQPFLWTRGSLRRLPPRLLAGVPAGVGAVAATGVLTPRGLLRAGFDMVLPSRALAADVSIGALVRRRLGHEVHERLIEPLLGGIHAGECDALSVRATAPQLAAAVASRRGLVRGLRAASAAQAPSGPTFLTLAGGLGDLVAALVARLGAHAELRHGSTAGSLAVAPHGRVQLTLADGEQLLADRVVLAVPAFAAARILSAACPAAASELSGIDYASVATVAFAYPERALPRALTGSGFLVPRSERRLLTACTWSSAKWAHLAGAPVVLRASVGHMGDERALELSDEQLTDALHAELVDAMGLDAAPIETLVTRFPDALPQYRVGHLERLARIETALAALPAVRLAGATYRGVGIGACIRDGEAAATALAGELAAAPNEHRLAQTTT